MIADVNKTQILPTNSNEEAVLQNPSPKTLYNKYVYQICKTIYSNTEVYELYINQDLQVMRRTKDSFLNLSHILKAGKIDRMKTPKIFNDLISSLKEVQFDKVQGGYSKYQGTWIPLKVGIDLAKRYGCYELIKPIIELDLRKEYPFKLTKKMEKEISRRNRRQNMIRNNDERLAAGHRRRGRPLKRNTVGFPPTNTLNNPIFPRPLLTQNKTCIQAPLVKTSLENLENIEYLRRIISQTDKDYDSVKFDLAKINMDEKLHISLDEDGNNILHWAMYYSDYSLIKIILETNALLLSTRNCSGLTPLSVAFKSAYAYTNKNMHQVLAIVFETEGISDIFMQSTDQNRNNILHDLIINKNEGSKKNSVNYYLDTILEGRNKETIMIETVGKMLETKNNHNQTPLSLVSQTYNDWELLDKINRFKNSSASSARIAKKKDELLREFDNYLDMLKENRADI